MKTKDQVGYLLTSNIKDMTFPTKVHISLPDHFFIVLTTNTHNVHVHYFYYE